MSDTPDILKQILYHKHEEVAAARAVQPLAELRARIADQEEQPRGFVRALRAAEASGWTPVIAEVKKGSPSKGVIRADFDPLATAFKRMQNILDKAPEEDAEPDPAKMTDDAEKALALDYLQARGMLDDLVGNRRYRDALSIMASLGPSLDLFFTEVLVMAEDPDVRTNRIALLRSIRDQFVRVARFSCSSARR